MSDGAAATLSGRLAQRAVVPDSVRLGVHDDFERRVLPGGRFDAACLAGCQARFAGRLDEKDAVVLLLSRPGRVVAARAAASFECRRLFKQFCNPNSGKFNGKNSHS